MCGLVGIAGDINVGLNKVFRNLLLLDQIRGFHSTGVAKVGASENVSIAKELGTPADLWRSSWFFDNNGTLRSYDRVVIGHNRAATTGPITKENAHPFTFDHITGAHNGTLHEYDGLEGAKTFDVDSKAIFNDISIKGIEHTWSNFIGAAALTWWDGKNKTINLVRNEDRPLYLAKVKGGRAIIWASESWMIEAAIKGTGVELADTFDETIKDNPYSIKPHFLHVFKPTMTNIKLHDVTELKPKPKPPAVVRQIGFGNREGGDWGYFNWGWAKGLPKAPKNILNKKFKLRRALQYTMHSTKSNYYVLEGIVEGSGDSISVYPDNYKEWSDMSKVIYNPATKDTLYTIVRRPRIQANYNGKYNLYKIPSNGFRAPEVVDLFLEEKQEPKFYVGANDSAVTREELQKDISIAGGECCICAKQLTPDDEVYFYYSGSVVCCNDCKDNEWANLYGWRQ